MKDKVLLVFLLEVCFFRTYQLSNPKPPEALCLITGLIVHSSGLPTAFYDMMDSDESDDGDSKYNNNVNVFKTRQITRTPITSEKPIIDEWKQRGEFRVQCVNEIGLLPSKVVTLMTGTHWKTDDPELKKWVLCVLMKMNLMSSQGVYKMDVAMSKTPPKEKLFAEEMIDLCLPKKTMQPQDIAWHYVKCHSRSLKGNFTNISIF